MTLSKYLYGVFFTTIVFVLELGLSTFPNINLTFVLFLILFQQYKIGVSMQYIGVYMMLQGVWWGFDLYLIPMFIAWVGFAMVANTIKRLDNVLQSFIIGGYAIVYAASFIPISVVLYGIPLVAYIIADIPFTMILIINNFLTVLWLKPLITHRITHKNRL